MTKNKPEMKSVEELSEYHANAFRGNIHICNAYDKDLRCLEQLFMYGHASRDAEISILTAKVKRYETALLSISKNSCCDNCQEAKLVAVAALNQGDDK